MTSEIQKQLALYEGAEKKIAEKAVENFSQGPEQLETYISAFSALAKYKMHDLIKLLVQEGADLNIQDEDIDYGHSPFLTMASIGLPKDLLIYLLANGANLDSYNNEGEDIYKLTEMAMYGSVLSKDELSQTMEYIDSLWENNE